MSVCDREYVEHVCDCCFVIRFLLQLQLFFCLLFTRKERKGFASIKAQGVELGKRRF